MNSSESSSFNFPEVRVVEASAGSGKTYALAKRYIQLICNPNIPIDSLPIRSILALTFTNKASIEMKERILEFLKALALAQMDDRQVLDMLHPLDVSVEEVRLRAFTVMDQLIRHYNYFQVQTIDKFINALLSGCAFKIGLTANFRIKTNAFEYMQQSVDELLDLASIHPDVYKSFHHFLNNYLYLENRTGWFPKEDIMTIMMTLFHIQNTYGLRYKQCAYSSDDIYKKKKVVLKEIKTLFEQPPENIHKGFLKSLEKFVGKHEKSFDIDDISDYFAREDIPIKKGSDVPTAILKRWQKIRLSLIEVCEAEAYSLFNPYMTIYEMAMTQLKPLMQKDDVLFLEQLNSQARHLFDQEHITVEELYYRLASRFEHYLIDEFQDTSQLQWENLHQMIEEALSTGGSLFYVGDRKQAIYGFRGGDVRLFDNIKDVFENFNVVVEPLTRNWRSHQEIVQFNNNIFSIENLKNFVALKEQRQEQKNVKTPVVFNQREYDQIETIFEMAHQTPREDLKEGYVSIQYVDIDKKEDRDEYVQNLLNEQLDSILKRYECKDVAILTRNNAQVETVTKWLLQKDIAVESDRTSNIQEHTLVIEVLAFLKFLNSPIDNVSFAQFILGEAFGRIANISSSELHQFVFNLRDQMFGNKEFYLYRSFREEYEEVWNSFINEFFRNIGVYPLYELVVSIYHRWGLLDAFPGDQGFLMHLLEMIKKHEEESSDVGSFIDYFEQCQNDERYVPMPAQNAIKVTTVHKAKGLEYPVVIVPFLGIDIQVGARGSDNKQSYVLKQDENSLQLVRLKEKYYKYSDELYEIYRQEYVKAFLAELNNVYVSLTRASSELYVYIPKRIKNSFNIVKFLIPEDRYVQGQQTNVKNEDVVKSEKPLFIEPSKYHHWIEYLSDEFVDSQAVELRKERVLGEQWHLLLSHIGAIKKDDLASSIDQAIELAKERYPEIESQIDVKNKLADLIETKDIVDLFITNAEVFTEKEFVNSLGHAKRVDRLLVFNDEVWIVDFKSSEEGVLEGQKQMREYMAIVRQVYVNKQIKGFIINLNDFTRQAVDFIESASEVVSK